MINSPIAKFADALSELQALRGASGRSLAERYPDLLLGADSKMLEAFYVLVHTMPIFEGVCMGEQATRSKLRALADSDEREFELTTMGLTEDELADIMREILGHDWNWGGICISSSAHFDQLVVSGGRA